MHHLLHYYQDALEQGFTHSFQPHSEQVFICLEHPTAGKASVVDVFHCATTQASLYLIEAGKLYGNYICYWDAH